MYLLEFLKTYSLWLENGAPHEVVFYRNHGLCLNITGYVEQFFPDDPEVEDKLYEELLAAFKQDQMSLVLPFTAWAYYNDESKGKYCHLNQGRNEWISKKIKELSSSSCSTT